MKERVLKARRHFVALDGLRGIAAITVHAIHLVEFVPVAAPPAQGQLGSISFSPPSASMAQI